MKRILDNTYLRCAIFCTYVIGLGFIAQLWFGESARRKQDFEIIRIVESTIRSEAERNVLMPKIVAIATKEQLNSKRFEDSVISVITQVVARRYLDTTVSASKIKPFFLFPEARDRKGNYTLTSQQFEELDAHIEYLSKQVSSEVDRVKEEISNDMDRINTWVTIWIGVIGVIGIFIPIVINIDTSNKSQIAFDRADLASKSAESATEKANSASSEAKKALDALAKAQTEIDKIAELELTIKKSEKTVKNIKDLSDEASTTASHAKQKSDILEYVYSVDRIGNLRPEILRYIDESNRNRYLRNILTSVRQAMTNCLPHYDIASVRETTSEFLLAIRRVRYSRFTKAEVTGLLDEFANTFQVLLDGGYNDESFREIVGALERLIERLVVIEAGQPAGMRI